GFEKLEKFNLLYVSNNPRLNEIKGFAELIEVKNVDIKKNEALTAINGFGALTLISQNIRMDLNPLLENIPAFNTLEKVGGVINLSNNYLNFQNSFTGLKVVEAEIHITNNSHPGIFHSFRELETFTGEYFT